MNKWTEQGKWTHAIGRTNQNEIRASSFLKASQGRVTLAQCEKSFKVRTSMQPSLTHNAYFLPICRQVNMKMTQC